jgi:hypothetical protein
MCAVRTPSSITHSGRSFDWQREPNSSADMEFSVGLLWQMTGGSMSMSRVYRHSKALPECGSKNMATHEEEGKLTLGCLDCLVFFADSDLKNSEEKW